MSLLKSSNLPAKSFKSDFDVFKNINDFFNRSNADFYDASSSDFSPLVNIEESEDGYHVEAEIPGVKKEDVEVHIKDDYLVIKGEKKSFNEDKRGQYHRIERSHGSFYRTIVLPSDIDKENIKAELKDGILKIDISKSQEVHDPEKKIAIH